MIQFLILKSSLYGVIMYNQLGKNDFISYKLQLIYNMKVKQNNVCPTYDILYLIQYKRSTACCAKSNFLKTCSRFQILC